MADKTTGQEPLTQLRQRIDRLDEEILQRLNERARCAVQVADVKKLESEDVNPVYYRLER